MKRAEMTAILYRLNEISDLVGRLGDPYTEVLARAASDLRWSFAEGGLSLRERIGTLARANRLIGQADHILSLRAEYTPQSQDHIYLYDVAAIALSEIGACAGEKRHDWRKIYPE